MRKNKEVKIEYIKDNNIKAVRGSSIGLRGMTGFNQMKLWKTGSADRSIRASVEKGFWIGNEDFDKAPFRVSMDGQVGASNYSLYNYYTAGENITTGKLCCIKGKVEVYCNDSDADQNVEIFSDDAYVDSSNPNDNFGNLTLLYAENNPSTAVDKFIYIKINISNGLHWSYVQKAVLKLYLVFNNIITNGTLNLYRVTSSWDESTITYNTRPTNDTFIWGSIDLTTLSQTGQYYEIDITELYKLWKRGTSDGGYDNYGFVLKFEGGGEGSIAIGSKERIGGGIYDQKPYMEFTNEIESDGLAYLASAEDYNKVKHLIGIATEDKSMGELIRIQSLIDKSIYGNGSGFTAGKRYYLIDDNGTIGSYVTPKTSGKWNVFVGTGISGGKLLVERDPNPLFIRSFTYDDLANNSSFKVVAPSQCSKIYIQYSVSVRFGGSTNTSTIGQFILLRDRITSQTIKDIANVYAKNEYVYINADWDTNAPGNGNLSISVVTTMIITGGSITIYFYE